MKILITGGAGFIGSYLTRELSQNGHEIVVFDSFVNYISPLNTHYQDYLRARFDGIIPDDIESIRGDTRNRSEIHRAIQESEPDRVVHLAALPIADVCNEHSEEAMSSIIQGTVNVLEAIRDVDSVDRFVYASSSMIYGDFQYRPADESHPKNPKGVYGGAKFAGETITRAFCRRFGFDFTVVRPSAVYGPTDANRRVSQIFVENALRGLPLELHGGGSQKLDFTYVTDTAHGFALATTHPDAANENYNITHGEGRSIKELAEVISNYVADVEMVEVETDVFRPKRGALDIDKAKQELDYQPEYSLEDGMEEYIEFVREMGLIEKTPVEI